MKKTRTKFILKRDPWIIWEMLESEAFKKLSASGMRVLLRFLQKRTWEKKKKRGGRPNFINNGLSFTYIEAQEVLGISISTFWEIIKRLVELGFIDIEHQGGGIGRDYSRYAISERWRDYGTPQFKEVKKKRVLQPGLDVQSWKRKLGKATGNRSCQLRKTIVINDYSEIQGIGKP